MTRRFVVNSLAGRPVRASDGTHIGHVTDVQFELPGWRVTALLVQVLRPILEKLEIDEPVIAGSRLLVLPPDRVTDLGEEVLLDADVWDVGRMTFR